MATFPSLMGGPSTSTKFYQIDAYGHKSASCTISLNPDTSPHGLCFLTDLYECSPSSPSPAIPPYERVSGGTTPASATCSSLRPSLSTRASSPCSSTPHTMGEVNAQPQTLPAQGRLRRPSRLSRPSHRQTICPRNYTRHPSTSLKSSRSAPASRYATSFPALWSRFSSMTLRAAR